VCTACSAWTPTEGTVLSYPDLLALRGDEMSMKEEMKGTVTEIGRDGTDDDGWTEAATLIQN
jgi:hypothetical protein